jgi:death-on-curing protein
MREPIWVLKQTVLVFHLEQLAEHGGSDGLRDEGLLESALAKPKNKFAYQPEITLAALAASYAFGIARNHPFVDGNKRAALVTAETFLELNGYIVEASKEAKYLNFIRLADGSLTEVQLAKWYAEHLISL